MKSVKCQKYIKMCHKIDKNATLPAPPFLNRIEIRRKNKAGISAALSYLKVIILAKAVKNKSEYTKIEL